ncbi:MAG: cytochrome c oxidase subunit II [Phycisphaerae bacterium]|nr:cytochrome c oxidase subunit II [Phycisphaerae bacterium]
MIQSLLEPIIMSTLAEATEATGKTFWMPEAASSVAGQIDWILEFINVICYVFLFLVTAVLVWFAVKYRRKPGEHAINDEGPTHGLALELTWTLIPTGLVVAIFWVGMVGYIDLRESPEDSYEVSVTGQQWFWTFNHPQYGVIQSNELHVPLNRPVRLIMGSTDVLHSLFVPAFRVKQDLVPGRYSTLWFKAIKAGSYQLYCTEYCGKDHSKMLATVHVLPEDEFQETMGKFAREYEDLPDNDLPVYALTRLYNRCSSCHSLDGTNSTGPTFKGLWDRVQNGDTVFTDGTTLKDYMGDGGEYEVPENYIRESILNPGKLIRENYANVMPNNFASQLKPRQVEALVLMMKNLDKLTDEGWVGEDGKVQTPEQPAVDSSASAGPGMTEEGG